MYPPLEVPEVVPAVPVPVVPVVVPAVPVVPVPVVPVPEVSYGVGAGGPRIRGKLPEEVFGGEGVSRGL